MKQPQPGSRVVVAMSGGVDSSVAAALLVEQGFDVVGIAMRLWGEASESGCCSIDDFVDARRVAARFSFPFYVMDFRDEFRRSVVEPFIGDYLAGRTPNPCARCNQFVKFAGFWDRAVELGGEWIATGHYARIRRDESNGTTALLAAADPAKDQSYYLFGIRSEVLERCLFPVGEWSKPQVRERAEQLGLSVAQKPDSQDICFAPRGQYGEFVARQASVVPRPGNIVDADGQTVGSHDGVHQFTVGQRHGLRVSAPQPLYVTDIDAAAATVRVGPKSAVDSHQVTARQVNWLTAELPQPGRALTVKIRSRFEPATVVLAEVSVDHFVVQSERGLPAVTPGQAAVLYDGDRVLGGGWIERRAAAA